METESTQPLTQRELLTLILEEIREFKALLTPKLQELATEDKPVCPICGKTFANKYVLRTHIKNIHEDKTKIECPVCNKKLSSKYYLNTHLKKKHPEYIEKEAIQTLTVDTVEDIELPVE